MKEIKVLGSGCSKCRSTIQLIEEVAKARSAGIRLEKVQDMQEIARYGVMSTPGVVIDGQVVHAGGIPSRAKVEGWF